MLKFKASVLLLLSTLALCPPASAAINANEKIDYSPVYAANFTLTFGVQVDPTKSSVSVYGTDGQISVGTLRTGANVFELLVPVRSDLPPGSYSVIFDAAATSGAILSGMTQVDVPAPAKPKFHQSPQSDLLGAR